ncbi:TPA: hypothetical protein ACV474_005755 [Pseudomonas aeruginosa]|jgi:hypothetical protein|uniref:hypothetical protein n=1 Tax=Pseudomonas aeruginosa TaxID=287 RepID=UPI00290423E8|nr:hypothetical protein [Pseudomonas aeruginosa]MDU0533198.1 hypothetical protein [Pseudomonas aeruginosa]MEA8677853.1 hypothetical protein [Pseudomonas aeruginosa]MEA8690869.1 hypothetical protein [Pseudomonas aeruginosa]
MTTRVYRDLDEPLRTGLSHSELWQSYDKGLIISWEVGRALAEANPEIAEQCLQGELPVLGWKGGCSRRLLKIEKFGSLLYLAQWQGIRGESLDIDQELETTITCSKTGMIVTFTPDQAKYANPV